MLYEILYKLAHWIKDIFHICCTFLQTAFTAKPYRFHSSFWIVIQQCASEVFSMQSRGSPFLNLFYSLLYNFPKKWKEIYSLQSADIWKASVTLFFIYLQVHSCWVNLFSFKMLEVLNVISPKLLVFKSFRVTFQDTSQIHIIVFNYYCWIQFSPHIWRSLIQ